MIVLTIIGGVVVAVVLVYVFVQEVWQRPVK